MIPIRMSSLDGSQYRIKESLELSAAFEIFAAPPPSGYKRG